MLEVAVSPNTGYNTNTGSRDLQNLYLRDCGTERSFAAVRKNPASNPRNTSHGYLDLGVHMVYIPGTLSNRWAQP